MQLVLFCSWPFQRTDIILFCHFSLNIHTAAVRHVPPLPAVRVVISCLHLPDPGNIECPECLYVLIVVNCCLGQMHPNGEQISWDIDNLSYFCRHCFPAWSPQDSDAFADQPGPSPPSCALLHIWVFQWECWARTGATGARTFPQS